MLWSSSHKNEILSSARGKRNRMKKRRNLFSYHHLVLLALAVLLAFQAIERMCGPFRVVADFYATQMGLLKHSQQGNTHAKLDNSELFWLLHILMKLGSLVKLSWIHGISENIKNGLDPFCQELRVRFEVGRNPPLEEKNRIRDRSSRKNGSYELLQVHWTELWIRQVSISVNLHCSK